MTTKMRDETRGVLTEGTPVGSRTSWCGDCRAETMFEAVLDETDGALGHDWACTVCGAAYSDLVDLPATPAAAGREVA
jgi:hypothetical protein